jgi:hypothetical protein
MVSVDAFSKMVSAVYACAVEPARMDESITTICQTLGAKGGALVMSHGAVRTQVAAVLPADLSADLSAALLAGRPRIGRRRGGTGRSRAHRQRVDAAKSPLGVPQRVESSQRSRRRHVRATHRRSSCRNFSCDSAPAPSAVRLGRPPESDACPDRPLAASNAHLRQDRRKRQCQPRTRRHGRSNAAPHPRNSQSKCRCHW